MKMVVGSVLTDQICNSPTCNYIVMILFDMCGGKSLSDSSSSALAKLPHVLKVNYMIWPLAQFINFKFVPVPT